MNTLQDLAIYRMEGGKKQGPQKYEYQLFVNGKSSKTYRSDIEYQLGEVNINPIDGSITLNMLEDYNQVESKRVEDKNTFFVSVIIKS